MAEPGSRAGGFRKVRRARGVGGKRGEKAQPRAAPLIRSLRAGDGRPTAPPPLPGREDPRYRGGGGRAGPGRAGPPLFRKRFVVAVNGDAQLLMAEMLNVFVREAAARAARQAQAEDLEKVDIEHVEKVLPQL
ncbi:hypothetical protein QYF61_022992, partial [Mycteria americana]